jgi:hypothetical protein
MPQKPRGTHQRTGVVVPIRRSTRPPAGDNPGRRYYSAHPVTPKRGVYRYTTSNLGALGQEIVTGGGVTVSPELVAAEAQRLAAQYDASNPQVPFSTWAAAQGAGGLVDEYRAALTAAAAAGDPTAAARAAALDAAPAGIPTGAPSPLVVESPPMRIPEATPAPPRPVLPTIADNPAEFQQVMTRLADGYDAAKPQQSFTQYAEAQGFGSMVEEYKALLRSSGDIQAIAALDVVPPPPPKPLSKRAKRRKKLKKIAAVAAIVVGAVFLGPMVAGAFKAVMAKGAIAGKLAAAGKAAKLAKLAKIATTAAKVMPKVIQGVNAVRTVAAIRDGEVPPPPIELEGSRFTDYAAAIGTNLAQTELQQQGQAVDERQRALLEADMAAEVRELQYRAGAELPARSGSLPMYSLPAVNGDVREAMAASAAGQGDVLKFAAIAGGALLLLMLSKSR